MSRRTYSIEILKARGQAALLEFLKTDLDLAFTFLETAEIEAASDAPHSEAAMAKARKALGIIRQFEERIEAPTARQQIHARADELELALQSAQTPLT